MNHKNKIHPCAEEVMSRFSDMVFRVALSRTGNYNDAEDITQEVFLKYIQKDKKYEDWEHIKAWLIRVTANLSKNLVNSAWHRHTTTLEDGMDVEVESPEVSEILEAVQQLPEKYREIIRLYYIKGYRVEEISRQLMMNESTVKTRLSRGRKKLREILGVFVLFILIGAIGVSVFRSEKNTPYNWERMTNSAGVVSGNGVYIREDFSDICEKLKDDTIVVQASDSESFSVYRKLTEHEIHELYEKLCDIMRKGNRHSEGTVHYYRICEKTGEMTIFYLRE